MLLLTVWGCAVSVQVGVWWDLSLKYSAMLYFGAHREAQRQILDKLIFVGSPNIFNKLRYLLTIVC